MKWKSGEQHQILTRPYNLLPEDLVLTVPADVDAVVAKHFSVAGVAVVWLEHCVLMGRWQDKQFHFFRKELINPALLQALRVFNDVSELFLWRTEIHGFAGRVRTDGQGEDILVADIEQPLQGMAERAGDGWVCQRERNRGFSLMIPVDGPAAARMKIGVRYYIGYNAINQAGYVDCRFVKLTGGEK